MKKGLLVFVAFLFASLVTVAVGQTATPTPAPTPAQKVRIWSIPISIYTKKELEQNQASEFLQTDKLSVKENGDEQQILSIRALSDSPLSLAVVVQDDLSSNINLQLEDIRQFIRGLPKGSRVMVAYIRGGSAVTLQKFTDDREKAAKSLRIIAGSSSGGTGPYGGLNDVLKRFEALPSGRRAVLMISDGVDTSQGSNVSSLVQTIDLENAIARAQRNSVAVYSIYSPTALTSNSNSPLVTGGQGALLRISDETGGRSFYQGSIAPVSFTPFIRDLNLLLGRQFSLTYLSTHMKKGYYRVEVTSSNPDIKIEHPKGYYFR
ncbi:MAG TPA: hypothetical protein PKA82_12365 [Pyrinomonadaceae bacterium]|nr:hypothetical protein [Pyrinomonadaceae bacterium]